MAIKHAAVKVPEEVLHAAEWNAPHTIENKTVTPAKLNLTVEPVPPSDGDLWYDVTEKRLKAFVV